MLTPFLARMRAWRLLTPALLCVFSPAQAGAQALLVPPTDHTTLPTVSDMATMVDMAWARSPRARQIQGMQLEAQSQSDLATRWFPGAPSLTLGQRSGDRPGQRSLREQEVAIQAPLWSSGRRAATSEVSQVAMSAAHADLLAWRLDLSYQVRERIEALNLATVSLQHAQAHADNMRQLDGDVARRVKAGDMATVDALLMRQDVLNADSAVSQARLALIEAEHAFHVLVGEVRPVLNPHTVPANLSDAQLDELQAKVHDRVLQHPRLMAAQAEAAHQSKRHALQADAVRMPWEVGVMYRRDQEAQGNRALTSWGLNLKLPLTDDPALRQAAMAARTAADVADAEAQRAHDLLESDLLEAIPRVRHQQAMHAQARAMADAARSRLDLIRKAYALGEMGLSDRLKAEVASAAAALRVTEQGVLLAQASAQLQYALGEQP